jgi:hypothetical protein
MRSRLIIVAAGLAAAAGVVAMPQANAGSVCVKVHVEVNGQAVDQAPCVDIPDSAPPLP